MERSRKPFTIYQLRIVLRGVSPLIWRRVLVHDTTTLAQLHDIIQILFEWRDEHLYDFHIYGKDYGTSGTDTRGATLRQFQFRKGERFRYVYDYYAYWVCDIRLEATLPVDPKLGYPVCTGSKNASPSENFQGERPSPTGTRCASVNGFSLHATTQVPAHCRDQLERLIRYTARGAESLERLKVVCPS